MDIHPHTKNAAAQAARARFIYEGRSIADWARTNGFSPKLVYEVMAGRPALRGKSHIIAVLLGLKDGLVRERKGRRASR